MIPFATSTTQAQLQLKGFTKIGSRAEERSDHSRAFNEIIIAAATGSTQAQKQLKGFTLIDYTTPEVI
jgi:hypothetical protein